MRRVRDSENPEGARNCRIGGVEGLLNSGKYRRWYSWRVGIMGWGAVINDKLLGKIRGVSG